MTNNATRQQARTEESCPDLSGDILRGAEQIAVHLFGSSTKPNRKKVYYLVEKTNLPVFRLGSVICARKSTLLKWVEAQEQMAVTRN